MAQAPGEASLPADLVGSWHYNWVSDVHQRDPVSGRWLPPTALDITFVFTADGQFELRDFRQASNWCTLTTYQTINGHVAVDDATLVVYPARGHVVSQSDCRADWNYERDSDGGQPGGIGWRWGHDALGNPALVLAWPPGEEHPYVQEPGGVAVAPHGTRLDSLDRPSG